MDDMWIDYDYDDDHIWFIVNLRTLQLSNISPWYRWPIEIDGEQLGLPVKTGDFPWLC